jgi:hypothetical protein
MALSHATDHRSSRFAAYVIEPTDGCVLFTDEPHRPERKRDHGIAIGHLGTASSMSRDGTRVAGLESSDVFSGDEESMPIGDKGHRRARRCVFLCPRGLESDLLE